MKKQQLKEYNKGKSSLSKVLSGKRYQDQFVRVYDIGGKFSIYNKSTSRCIAGTDGSNRMFIQVNSWYAPYMSRYFAGKGYDVQKVNSFRTNFIENAEITYKKIERWFNEN